MRLILLALLLSPARAAAPGRRDWLWHIVSRCLDTKAADYCARCLRPAPGLCGDVPCENRTFLWKETPDFAAIQDRKMCGCPADYVHGLALPRVPVLGVEDPKRPAGVWAFAWTAAKARIADEREILLAVNGPGRRTQDQLHVHILRLRPDGRRRLLDASAEKIDDLSRAWDAAARHAKRLGLKGWYGVAVAQAEDGKSFLVAAVPDGGTETDYGLAFCR